MSAIFSENIYKLFFFNENYYVSNQIPLKFVPKKSNWQYVIIGSDNGLALNRQFLP